jgi:hypothetical protein
MIIYFYFTKTYIHIFNLYSILKTFEHNVLLVRQLHPVSLAFLPSGHGFKPHLLHRFLTFYAYLIKFNFTQCLSPFFHQNMGSNPTSCTVGPAQSASRHDVSGPKLWPVGVWPVLGRRLASTGWPGTVNRSAWRVWARVVARGVWPVPDRRLVIYRRAAD